MERTTEEGAPKSEYKFILNSLLTFKLYKHWADFREPSRNQQLKG
jgi:hypothetical protein